MKWFFCTLLVALAWNKCHAAPLEIREGDHICIIGNILAESMQSEGHNHWETMLYQGFPKHKLVVRNLAWADDEVVLRPRPEGFGSPDEDLILCKADVVIAFFGFHESSKGEAGLPQFKSDVEKWIKHTKAQDYSGKGAPRIALVSPMSLKGSSTFQSRDWPGNIPNVIKLGDARLYPGKTSYIEACNTRLELYSRAMLEVAEKHKVVFAEMFTSLDEVSVEDASGGYSMKAAHLNPDGDLMVAATLRAALTEAGMDPPSQPPSLLDRLKESIPKNLRQEIEAKNKLWHQYYHLADGQPAPGDKSNRETLQRQREALDALVAQRDERIWQLAQSDEATTVNDKAPRK